MRKIIIAALLLLSINLQAKPKPCLGYWMVIDAPGQKIQVLQAIDIVDVYTVSEMTFPGVYADYTKLLKSSAFYQITDQNKSFYVEVKKITESGKFRKLSKKEHKKLYGYAR